MFIEYGYYTAEVGATQLENPRGGKDKRHLDVIEARILL